MTEAELLSAPERETYEARQEVGDGLHLLKKRIILDFIFGT